MAVTITICKINKSLLPSIAELSRYSKLTAVLIVRHASSQKNFGLITSICNGQLERISVVRVDTDRKRFVSK